MAEYGKKGYNSTKSVTCESLFSDGNPSEGYLN